jgi:hypothetical protein
VLVLFDHGTPKGLIGELPGHTVHTAQSKGWTTLSNGALLVATEEAGFELLLTTDRRVRYQQNLRGRRIALVVLTGSTKWSRVPLGRFNGSCGARMVSSRATSEALTASPLRPFILAAPRHASLRRASAGGRCPRRTRPSQVHNKSGR